MKALAKGAKVISSPDAYDHVVDELDELGRTARVMPLRRRRLLQSIHSLRALESAMKAVLRGNNIKPDHSMGDLMKQLGNLPATNPSRLQPAFRLRLQDGSTGTKSCIKRTTIHQQTMSSKQCLPRWRLVSPLSSSEDCRMPQGRIIDRQQAVNRSHFQLLVPALPRGT